jgi:DNA-binding protein HU-beta
MGLNKNDLAATVAEQTGINQRQAREAIDAAIELITDELAAGGEVALAGFGKFSVSHRSARQGRNPSTGQRIHIAACKAPKFSAASALKTRLSALPGDPDNRFSSLPGDPDDSATLSGDPD